MSDHVRSFYDSLADHYHLIFEDWNRSIARQAAILGPLIASGDEPRKILDCACGIGTQSLGLAALGHEVVASDLSAAAVSRATKEAKLRGLDIRFHVSDMTSLTDIPDSDFDAVVALDNALPHLAPNALSQALVSARSKLKSGGTFVASIRDYDQLLLSRPTMQEPAFYGAFGERRIVHQVWDWMDDRSYTLHLYLSLQRRETWTTHSFISLYHSLLRDELSSALRSAAFGGVRWLMPADTGFYQPIVLATR